MNIAVVDDQQQEIDTLLPIITEYAALGQLDIKVHVFHSAEELLEDYHPYEYTAIFMDIYMQEMTGIQASQRILAMDPGAIIMFLTTSQDHMPDAFALHAFDYIPKPAEKSRIFKAMDDVLLRKTRAESAPKLTFTYNKREVTLPLSEIACIRTARHNYLDIISASGSTYTTRLTFSRVQRNLEDYGASQFLLIIRGILVNMDYIKNMEGEICILKDDTSLPVNTKNASQLHATWQNYTLDSIRARRRERRNRT